MNSAGSCNSLESSSKNGGVEGIPYTIFQDSIRPWPVGGKREKVPQTVLSCNKLYNTTHQTKYILVEINSFKMPVTQSK